MEGRRSSEEEAVTCYVRVQKQLSALSQGHFVIDASTAGVIAVESRASYYH